MSLSSCLKLSRILDVFLLISTVLLCINLAVFVFNHEALHQLHWLIIFIASAVISSVLACFINKNQSRTQLQEDNCQDVAVEVEDKPPEYEKVMEDAPPYTTVLMEDSYGVRLDTEINLDGNQQVRYECTSEVVTLPGPGQSQNNGAFGMSLGSGDAAHELSDPELPTYEEAVLIVGNSVDPSSF